MALKALHDSSKEGRAGWSADQEGCAGLVEASSKVLAVGGPGRGERGGIMQMRREASQDQSCFAGRAEVLTAWLGVGSEVMCCAGAGVERRGLRRGKISGMDAVSSSRDGSHLPQALGQRCTNQRELGWTGGCGTPSSSWMVLDRTTGIREADPDLCVLASWSTPLDSPKQLLSQGLCSAWASVEKELGMEAVIWSQWRPH